MRRRVESPGGFSVWPAFTDVLGGLVVVLVFLITIFIIWEVLISREMSGKDTAIDQLQRIIEHLEVLAGDAQAEAAGLRTRVAGLESELDSTRSARAELDRRLQESERERALLGERAQGMEEELDARQLLLARIRQELELAEAARQRLRQSLDDSEAERGMMQVRLEQTETDLDASRTALVEADSRIEDLSRELQGLVVRRDELERLLAERAAALNELARLRAQTEQALGEAQADADQLRAERDRLRLDLSEEQQVRRAELSEAELQLALLSARADRLAAELERLTRALTGKEAELADAELALRRQEAVLTRQEDRIAQLDEIVKRRLVERVEELEEYASDFYGRMRELFADNPNIRVEGDRFVFQSEVLFPSGDSTLTVNGRGDLDSFAEVYRSLADRLPDDLPVIFQVQGHTDRVPISTARFPSNWALSYARAQEVVDYLISRGVPPDRLAAVAMGEYHPADPDDSPEARRRNRRIELKITSR